jgi:hypothetical protein
VVASRFRSIMICWSYVRLFPATSVAVIGTAYRHSGSDEPAVSDELEYP